MTDTDLSGRTIGRYQLLALAGRGGMGVVYRARQADLGRIVALKLLAPRLSRDARAVSRFLDEARSAAALEHPHIVPIYDVGGADGLHYIAMKLVAGRTLADLLEESGPLDARRAASLAAQAADALDYAHAHGIIHRDIKPTNMMVDPGGWLYLTDFGLAQVAGAGGLAADGALLGTPEYMAPEQAQGLPATPASDIYSLGAVLFELLTGRAPFVGDTPQATLVARLQSDPPPPRSLRPDLPPAVEAALLRALARDPARRFATAGELAAALQQAAGATAAPAVTVARPATPPLGLAVGTPTIALPRAQAQPDHQQPAVDGGRPAGGAHPANSRPQPRARAIAGRWSLAVVLLIVTLALGLWGWASTTRDARVEEGLARGRAALWQPGGIDESLAAYREVLALDGRSAEAHAGLAQAELLRGRFAAAEEAARAALAADPGLAPAHALLAEALVGRGRSAEALAAAEQAVALAPDRPQGYGARAMARAAAGLRAADVARLDAAEADANTALRLAPGDLERALALEALGYALHQRFLLEDDALLAERSSAAFEEAARLQGQLARLHNWLGVSYNVQGEAALRRGDEALAFARLEQARRAFERALAADPSYAHAHAGLGWNLLFLKDYGGALGEFEQALALDPQDADAYTGLSRLYQRREPPDHALAIRALERAAQLTPTDPAALAAIGWAQIGQAFTRPEGSPEALAAYGAAEARFRQALRLEDSHIDALNGLGWSLRGLATARDDGALYAEAAEALRRSLAIKEDQHDAHFGLGWVAFAQADYRAAERSFRRAAELRPQEGGAPYWLGLSLERQGRIDEAREAYREAAARGSPYAPAELARLSK